MVGKDFVTRGVKRLVVLLRKRVSVEGISGRAKDTSKFELLIGKQDCRVFFQHLFCDKRDVKNPRARS